MQSHDLMTQRTLETEQTRESLTRHPCPTGDDGRVTRKPHLQALPVGATTRRSFLLYSGVHVITPNTPAWLVGRPGQWVCLIWQVMRAEAGRSQMAYPGPLPPAGRSPLHELSSPLHRPTDSVLLPGVPCLCQGGKHLCLQI